MSLVARDSVFLCKPQAASIDQGLFSVQLIATHVEGRLLTRFIAWAALRMIIQDAKTILIVSVSPVLLILGVSIFLGSHIVSAHFLVVDLYYTGLLHITLQAVVMPLLAVRFFKFRLMDHQPLVTFVGYLKTIGGYVLRVSGLSVAISVACFIVFSIGSVLADASSLSPQAISTVFLVLGLFVYTLLGWLWLRFALILPGFAVGQSMKLREAWRETRRYRFQAILLSIVCYVLPWIGVVAVLVLFQFSMFLAPVLITALIWVAAVLKITILATMFENLLHNRQNAMAKAFD